MALMTTKPWEQPKPGPNIPTIAVYETADRVWYYRVHAGPELQKQLDRIEAKLDKLLGEPEGHHGQHAASACYDCLPFHLNEI